MSGDGQPSPALRFTRLDKATGLLVECPPPPEALDAGDSGGWKPDPRTVTAVCMWLRAAAEDLEARRPPQYPAPKGSRWPWLTMHDAAAAVVNDITNQLAGLDPRELEQLLRRDR